MLQLLFIAKETARLFLWDQHACLLRFCHLPKLSCVRCPVYVRDCAMQGDMLDGLLQGGLVLSEAVKECGILAVAAKAIEDHTSSFSLWQVAAVFCILVLVCCTFVSHTVGAMVILPVVATVGEQMSTPHPQLLVMATVLTCSCAMGLPVSGAHSEHLILHNGLSGLPRACSQW